MIFDHNMNNQLYTEHAKLRPYVKDIWSFQSDDLNGSCKSFKFFADGLPGIMWQQSNHTMFLNRDEKKLSPLFLYGQTVRPIEITAFGSFRIIVFYLYPHVIKSLFGIEANELTDTCIDFDLLPFKGAKDLIERLSEGISIENQIQLLSSFMLTLIDQHNTSVERDLQYVTNHLASAKGNVPLKALQNDLQVSERTFERKFLQHVGVSPRLFARICRFNSALSQLRSNNYLKLTDIAYDSEFADQSHFARTFKEFTGLTPTEYLVNYQIVSEEC